MWYSLVPSRGFGIKKKIKKKKAAAQLKEENKH